MVMNQVALEGNVTVIGVRRRDAAITHIIKVSASIAASRRRTPITYAVQSLNDFQDRKLICTSADSMSFKKSR